MKKLIKLKTVRKI